MGIEVPIEFVASFDKSIKGLGDFAKQANDKIASVDTSLSTLKHAIEGLLIYKIGEKIVEGFGEVISQASESNRVISQLNQTLKASGDYSEQNVDHFRQMADELARTTKFDDDLILSQVRLAKQFNTTNREAEKLIRAAIDLSAATGDDLATSVQALGQTLDGTAGRIAQKIPLIQTLTAEQLRAGEAIDIVARRFKGFAEADLQTFDGALGQVTTGFHGLQKAFGSAIVDNGSVIKVFAEISKSLFDFVDFVKENKQALGDFVTDGILFTVDAFGILSESVNIAYKEFSIFKAQITAIAGGFAAFRLASSDAIEAFKMIKEVSANYKSDMVEIEKTSRKFDKVTQAAADLSVKIEKAQLASAGLAKTTKEVADGFDNQTNAFKRFDVEILNKVKALKEELKNIGDDKLATLENQYNYQVDLITKAYAYQESLSNNADKLEKEKLDLMYKLKKKYDQEYFDQLASKLQSVYQNPAQFLLPDDQKRPGGVLGLGSQAQTGIAAGLGAANGVLNGANGATQLVAGAGSAIGTYFLGPIGQLIGPILTALAKGPDAIRALVQDFAKSLPVVIANMVKGAIAFTTEFNKQIPTIIEGFIDELPDLIAALIEAVPDLVNAIIEGIPKIIIAIVTKLPAALVRAIGKVFSDVASSFVGKILEGAGQFVVKLIEGAGEVVAKLIEGVSHPFGKNGTFFNFSGNGFGLGDGKGLLGGGIISGILQQITAGNKDDFARPDPKTNPRREGPSHIEVKMQVGHNDFAKAIIEVKRLGYRLEPI